MPSNYTPTWQSWTPIEGINYWQEFFNMAVEWYREDLAHEMTIEEFLSTQQYLNCIETILTHQDARELWEQLADLRIPPFLFLTEYHDALEGRKKISNAKRDNDEAAEIEKQVMQLITTLDNSRYYSDFVSDLDRILERARYHQSSYKRERQVVTKTQSGLIDKTYFRKKLSNFFKQSTQQPRHNLLKIAFNVTFSEKIETTKIKNVLNRSNKNK